MRTFQRIARLIRPWLGLPVLAGLALAGLVVLALGCGGEGERGAAASAPALAPRVADVPVPAEFKFNEEDSLDRQAGDLRFIRHLYSGSASVRRVAEFYRRTMPAAGWKQIEESFAGGRQRFQFEKGRESCYISIWDDWGTKLLIQIFPTGGKPPEPGEVPGI